MVESLIQRFAEGDRLALSRLLTMVSRGQQLEAIEASLDGGERPRVVAFTGSGGVGKSSLVGRLIDVVRSSGKSVAVLACDPQSPVTGGALLGDRVRMPSRPGDDGLLVRSLAAPAGQQAIALNIPVMIRLLGRFGFDLVFIETVGAGQGDTAVRDLADTVVLLVQPEAGDELQWEKAGVLEIADVVVVHKGDLPGAERVEGQLNEMLHLPGCRATPVVRASAAQQIGLDEVWRAIESEADHAEVSD